MIKPVQRFCHLEFINYTIKLKNFDTNGKIKKSIKKKIDKLTVARYIRPSVLNFKIINQIVIEL